MKEHSYFQFEFETTVAEQLGTYDLNKSRNNLIVFFGFVLMLLINVPVIIILVLWRINIFTLMFIAVYAIVDLILVWVFYRRKFNLQKRDKIHHEPQFIKASFEDHFFIYVIHKTGFQSSSKIEWKNIEGFTLLKDWVILTMLDSGYMLKIKDWPASQKDELKDFLLEKIKQIGRPKFL